MDLIEAFCARGVILKQGLWPHGSGRELFFTRLRTRPFESKFDWQADDVHSGSAG